MCISNPQVSRDIYIIIVYWALRFFFFFFNWINPFIELYFESIGSGLSVLLYVMHIVNYYVADEEKNQVLIDSLIFAKKHTCM